MKLTYDKEADALYIRLLEGEYECRVVRLTEDIALDFAAGEKLVGIELLGASRRRLQASGPRRCSCRATARSDRSVVECGEPGCVRRAAGGRRDSLNQPFSTAATSGTKFGLPSDDAASVGELLRLTLDEARRIGLRRVLLTTETTNRGSIGVILANGGYSTTPVSRRTRVVP